MTWMVRTLAWCGLLGFSLHAQAAELQPVRHMPPLAPVPVVHQEFEPMPAVPQQPLQAQPPRFAEPPKRISLWNSNAITHVPTVQEIAAQEALERRKRIAARKWAGYSAGRPTVSPTPFFGGNPWHRPAPITQFVPVEPTLPPSIPQSNHGYRYSEDYE